MSRSTPIAFAFPTAESRTELHELLQDLQVRATIDRLVDRVKDATIAAEVTATRYRQPANHPIHSRAEVARRRETAMAAAEEARDWRLIAAILRDYRDFRAARKSTPAPAVVLGQGEYARAYCDQRQTTNQIDKTA